MLLTNIAHRSICLTTLDPHSTSLEPSGESPPHSRPCHEGNHHDDLDSRRFVILVVVVCNGQKGGQSQRARSRRAEYLAIDHEDQKAEMSRMISPREAVREHVEAQSEFDDVVATMTRQRAIA